MKKAFVKAEIEIIRFEKQDIIATSTMTFTGGGQGATGFQPGPAIPFPTGDAGVGSGTDDSGD